MSSTWNHRTTNSRTKATKREREKNKAVKGNKTEGENSNGPVEKDGEYNTTTTDGVEEKGFTTVINRKNKKDNKNKHLNEGKSSQEMSLDKNKNGDPNNKKEIVFNIKSQIHDVKFRKSTNLQNTNSGGKEIAITSQNSIIPTNINVTKKENDLSINPQIHTEPYVIDTIINEIIEEENHFSVTPQIHQEVNVVLEDANERMAAADTSQSHSDIYECTKATKIYVEQRNDSNKMLLELICLCDIRRHNIN
ncbi:hypothetical protein HAX54_035308 [Datura stramonium]|uniref:Uncharacterized protein n=1 Tax=Datura stramonium TaxID=4076 RepID=A0ABS8RP75_DATST|nr:hypothetical protein [Datura stramonium]